MELRIDIDNRRKQFAGIGSYAYGLYFGIGNVNRSCGYRYVGYSVRPVTE